MASKQSDYSFWKQSADSTMIQINALDAKIKRMKSRNLPYSGLAEQLSRLYKSYFNENAMRLYWLKKGEV